MKIKIAIWTICFVVLFAWAGSVFAQTAKPAAMKTVKLPSGEELFDISGEWNVLVENYDTMSHFGTYPQLYKITQEGSSFTGIRLKDSPPPAFAKAGSKCMQGEIDKSGVKKLDFIFAPWDIWPSNCKISEDGNKINIDVPRMIRITMTRK
jgi:hypothetical protein